MEAFIDQFGYLAIGLLIFVENMFPPIPSEIILPMSGFLTTTNDLTLPLVIAAATIGGLIGAYLLYGIGYLLSEDRLFRFFETKPLRMLGFKGDDIHKVVSWFDRRGQKAVLICRCVPGLRSLISLPAGTSKMNLVKFTAYTLIGSIIWNTLLCSLGMAAGSAWQQVANQVAWASDVVKIGIAVIVVGFAIFWIWKRIIPVWRKKDMSASADEDASAVKVAGDVTE